jgi:hypothetical protein
MTDTVIEKKEVPAWIIHRVNQIGGMNPFGKPNYRVIWGGNRTHKVGGKFKKIIYLPCNVIGEPPTALVTEVAEIRTMLKYHPFRWHLERWRGPEFYGTAEEWYQETWDEECQFHTQGDYPHEGDYEHIFYLGMCSHMKPGDTDWCPICKAGSGEYIPLEENLHILDMMIKAFQRSDDVKAKDEQKALFAREDKKREDRAKRVGDWVREAMRPTLATQPTSWQDGSRCSVPEASLETLMALPRTKLSFGQSNRAMPDQKQKQIEES